MLLGGNDAAAVTTFPATPGGKVVPVPGMIKAVRNLSPLVRLVSFALPLKFRGSFTSKLWSVLSVAWAYRLTRSGARGRGGRSEGPTSELTSLMRNSYAV